MIATRLDQISITYIAQPLFTDLSWEIHDNRCVGLVGPNGCGKSTLLRLIQGQLTSPMTAAFWSVSKSGCRIGYLPQEPDLDAGTRTVWQEALSASASN